jgi:hypothetical protein
MKIYMIGGALFMIYWIKVLLVEEKLRGWELFWGLIMTLWIVFLWPVISGLLISSGAKRLFE